MSKDNNNGARQSGKKQSNVLNYAVVMIICVIIIIIVAAMADDREDQIDDRIIETERANENIQKEIVSLKDENYKLSKQVEESQAVISQNESYMEVLNKLTEAWKYISAGDLQNGTLLLSSIDVNTLDEKQLGYFSALCKLANYEPAQ